MIAHKTKPDALGRRPWTMKEVHWLQANYITLGPDACAKLLERTPAACLLQAMNHHANKPKVKRAEIEPRICALHAQGMSDQAIANALGWTTSGRERVKYWRNLFGLPVNPQDCLKDGARGAKQACQNNGVKSLIELRHENARCEAARLGWFGAKSMVQVKVCETLREFGPGTVRQIVERQGKRFTRGSYTNARLHLNNLIDVGLVVAMKGSQFIYSLAYQPEAGGEED